MAWVDIEMVLDLLKTDESIKQVENPIDADIHKGCVEFKNVTFTYDDHLPLD